MTVDLGKTFINFNKRSNIAIQRLCKILARAQRPPLKALRASRVFLIKRTKSREYRLMIKILGHYHEGFRVWKNIKNLSQVDINLINYPTMGNALDDRIKWDLNPWLSVVKSDLSLKVQLLISGFDWFVNKNFSSSFVLWLQ